MLINDISVLSAGNSGIYTCSRTLLGLAHDGNAPAFFSTTNRFGAPYWAVLFSSSVGFACVFASIYRLVASKKAIQAKPRPY